jgi:GH43 family beta-xylosidase
MNNSNFKKTIYNEPFIYQRADPYVFRHEDGSYYFTASVPAYDRIVLRKSATLDGLANAEEVTIWEKHDKGIMSIHIWAPEIHYIDGKWYIYFAGADKDDIWALRPYVLECTGQNPMEDAWIEKGQMQAADSFSFQDFSLDMTVFENGGKWYSIWAEKVNVGKKISNLYIAQLESPTKLGTAQVLLTTPDYDWERVDFWVNEGPAVIKHDGKLYVTYSASATGACYCVGLLSTSENSDLLDPRAWKKSRLPVLQTDWEKGILGPGHNSFTKLYNEDKVEDVMIYHARQYDEIVGDPLYDPNRHTYRMKIQWNDEGPIFDYKNNF